MNARTRRLQFLGYRATSGRGQMEALQSVLRAIVDAILESIWKLLANKRPCAAFCYIVMPKPSAQSWAWTIVPAC
jgi:hypothetical protein